MPKCKVTLTANAGIIVEICQRSFALDALHNEKTLDFSALTEEMSSVLIKRFIEAPPDFLIYTHTHRDHYSESLTASLLEAAKEIKLIIPSKEIDAAGMGEYTVNGAIIRWKRLPHERNMPVENYSFLISIAGVTMLIPGDCSPGDARLAELIGNTKIDIAFLNFPWVAKQLGRDAIDRLIKPAHIVVYHLPFQSEDRFGFIRATALAIEENCHSQDIRLLTEFMQSETLYIQ